MTKQEQLDQLREDYRQAKTNLDRRLIEQRAKLLKWSMEGGEPMKLIEDVESVEYTEEELKEIFK